MSPIDVYLDDKNALQPDIIFISNENMGIVKNEKIKGAPDFIIEILSPGNKKHDIVKKPIYEEHGVKEYFIIDPQTAEVFTYYLVDGKYAKQKSMKGEVKSKLLDKTFAF